MPPSTPAQKRATAKHRAKRKRVELLLDPESEEAKALGELIQRHGSAAAAIKAALLSAVRKNVEPVKPPRAAKPQPVALDLPVGPVPPKPGARLKGKR